MGSVGPLRCAKALQLTLAVIKPDAAAHPLIVEVRTHQRIPKDDMSLFPLFALTCLCFHCPVQLTYWRAIIPWSAFYMYFQMYSIQMYYKSVANNLAYCLILHNVGRPNNNSRKRESWL